MGEQLSMVDTMFLGFEQDEFRAPLRERAGG